MSVEVQRLQVQVNRFLFSGILGFRSVAVNGVLDGPTARAVLEIAFWNLDRLKAPKSVQDALRIQTGGGPSGQLAVTYVAEHVTDFENKLRVLADELKLPSTPPKKTGPWLLYGLGAVMVLYFLGRGK
jgi:hypothetical protein